MNEYLYVSGSDPKKAEHTHQIQIQVKEKGPLIVSLKMTPKASGTHLLRQEIKWIRGLNQEDITNTLLMVLIKYNGLARN